ncbi:hypothetical protein [Roseibium sp. SCP14]|uniref:hypothetical protein n=1 Tax=Roseibium sp. SCP14 TaxID=3141375 RepID=UPI0033357D63
MIMPLKRKIHQIAPELQFWGYEGGNILAAIAGTGGFLSLYNGLRSLGGKAEQDPLDGVETALTNYPDILVTVGLAVIVLVTILFDHITSGSTGQKLKIWIDRTASIIGICLVGAAFYYGASWITFSAVSFVSASALLRLCRTSPVFLKLGGLMLAAGGIGLAGYGVSTLLGTELSLLPGLTIFTGIYVFFASLMTYQGGIFECNAFPQNSRPEKTRAGPFHPGSRIGRLLERRLDQPVTIVVAKVAMPSVFWVPKNVKANAPFLTSMWTRLPWRLLTGIAAIATGTMVGILFGIANVLWAVGDIAIGSLDWDVSDEKGRTTRAAAPVE